MAEESKAEESKVTNGTIENAVDELLGTKPAEDCAEGSGSQAERQDEKVAGWLTMLPKELRDGVDTAKYSSLGEYVKALKDNQQREVEPATKEEVDGKWSKLLEDARTDVTTQAEGEMLTEVIESLKAEGVNADEARKTLTTYVTSARKFMDRQKQEQEQSFASYIDDKWGDRANEYFDDANRGLKVIASEDIELLKTAKDEGLTKNPAFIEVCRMLGRRTSESTIGRESRSGRKDDFDPRNPLQYKH